MVPPYSHRVSRVRRYSGCATRSRGGFAYGALTLCRRPSHAVRLPSRFVTAPGAGRPPMRAPATPAAQTLPGARARRFGLFPVRSPLLGESFLLSFPAGTKMFQFPAFAPRSQRGVGIAPDGLPHSDIRGSQCICHSPPLFAACHVLLRLREPRHPPCALVVPFISFINRT